MELCAAFYILTWQRGSGACCILEKSERQHIFNFLLNINWVYFPIFYQVTKLGQLCGRHHRAALTDTIFSGAPSGQSWKVDFHLKRQAWSLPLISVEWWSVTFRVARREVNVSVPLWDVPMALNCMVVSARLGAWRRLVRVWVLFKMKSTPYSQCLEQMSKM